MVLESGTNYADDSNLEKRKAIYSYTNPKINLEEEVIKLIKPTSSVLDVGCGNGDLLIQMRNQGFSGNLAGIDISEGMIQVATEQSKKENLNIVFKTGNAEDLEFPDNTFDVIISKHVLYHVKDVSAAVKEAYRCLKSGSSFIVVLNLRKENNPKRVNFYKEIEKEFNLKINNIQNVLSIEDFEPFLSDFKEKKLLKFRNFIELKEAEPYVNYFDSHRDFFKPPPNNEQWSAVLQRFEDLIKNEIKDKGIFREKNAFGIFVAVK